MFKRLYNTMIEARTLQANYYIAQQLHRSEYKNESVGAIFAALNEGKLNDL